MRSLVSIFHHKYDFFFQLYSNDDMKMVIFF